MKMKLSILVALSENSVIGRDGNLPWRLPDELEYVKKTTMGHTLVMGRKTYESIGRPLPGRTSIVVSRNPKYNPHSEVIVVDTFERGIEAAAARGESEVFVFGGESIYAEALPRADRLYLTRVHAHVDGDAYFPPFDLAEWKLVGDAPHAQDDRHPYAYTHQIYERAE